MAAQEVDVNCLTDSCNFARETLQRVDHSVSPCQDFYQFSCGRWVAFREADVLNKVKNVPVTMQDELQQKLYKQIHGNTQTKIVSR